MSEMAVSTCRLKSERGGSVLSASLWMIILSTLLCWLPFVGPFIAGVVGGRSAKSVSKAIMAVFLPIIVIAVLIFFFGNAITGLPIVGALLGLGTTTLLIIEVGPLLLGAIVGAILS